MPFKWPGSKHWLHHLAAGISGRDVRRIVEPFAGSAAFFLESRIKDALLVDINPRLTCALEMIRDKPGALIKLLSEVNNTQHYFDLIKAVSTQNKLLEAARLIFLANTSWGGIYRENQRGEYNVPFGNNGRPVFSPERIMLASKRLQSATIRCGTFEIALFEPLEGDLFFVDPPYAVASGQAHFNRYTRSPFSWASQCQLAKILTEPKFADVPVIVAGPDRKDWHELYSNWKCISVVRRNTLVSKGRTCSKRGEALLVNSKAVRVLNRLTLQSYSQVVV